MCDVKHLIWDVDGTLYKRSRKLERAIKERIYVIFAEELNIPLQDSIDLFEKEWNKIGVGTEIFKKYGIKPIILLNAMNDIDKSKYIERDQRLIDIFLNKLSNYNHYILTSTTRNDLENTLKILGLSTRLFKVIFTFEDLTVHKPSIQSFQKIIDHTHDLPKTHVFIGDSERMDIIPANKLGMITIMVWKKSKIADYSINSVYDVPKIINQLNN